MISAHVLELNKKLDRTLLTVRFNPCKPCFNQAIHVLLMHSFSVVAFFFLVCFVFRILDSLRN